MNARVSLYYVMMIDSVVFLIVGEVHSKDPL